MSKFLWKGEQVIGIINGHGPSDWSASGVSIDTRTLKKGDIFFALAGPNYDGHQFISSAIKKGASIVISNAPSLAFKDKVIIVSDVFNALISLGRFSRKRNKGKIIAITGSSGKTTVKEMLALSLSKSGKIHYSEASYNNKIGVSLSLSRMPIDSDFSIFELGMNNAGEISYLSNLVEPHIALINNTGNAHIGNLNSKKEIEKAKMEIVSGITSNGKLIINENISLSSYPKKLSENKNLKILKFGYKKNSNFILEKYLYSSGLSLIDATINRANISYSLKAPGSHMAMNSIAVIGVCFLLGVSPDVSKQTISNFESMDGRGKIHDLSIIGKKIEVIDESYNANPESTKSSINLLSEIDFLKSKRKILVFGDMLELGNFSKEMHIDIASFINESDVDLVFCIGSEIKNLWDNLILSKRGYHSIDPEILISSLKNKLKENDLILIKGSSKSGIKIIFNALMDEQLNRNIA